MNMNYLQFWFSNFSECFEIAFRWLLWENMPAIVLIREKMYVCLAAIAMNQMSGLWEIFVLVVSLANGTLYPNLGYVGVHQAFALSGSRKRFREVVDEIAFNLGLGKIVQNGRFFTRGVVTIAGANNLIRRKKKARSEPNASKDGYLNNLCQVIVRNLVNFILKNASRPAFVLNALRSNNDTLRTG